MPRYIYMYRSQSMKMAILGSGLHCGCHCCYAHSNRTLDLLRYLVGNIAMSTLRRENEHRDHWQGAAREWQAERSGWVCVARVGGSRHRNPYDLHVWPCHVSASKFTQMACRHFKRNPREARTKLQASSFDQVIAFKLPSRS